MVASPSDVPEARDAVHRALHSWNDANARNRNVILLPLRWETSVVPLMGEDAQGIINRQLVDEADIVIALFGARLGQQTPRALSGTAEEMNRAHSAGKPVHPYFSDGPIDRGADLDELKRLREFQGQLGGLYAIFSNPTQLETLVWQAIEHDLSQLEGVVRLDGSSSGDVDFLVQSGSERLSETDSKGRLKYKTRRWVDLTNRGEVDAENVTVEAAGGTNFWLTWRGPTTIQHGQTRQIPVSYSMATGRVAILVKWSVDGRQYEREFDVE